MYTIIVLLYHNVELICYLYTVETGFRMSAMTISESATVEQTCVTTMGAPATDTIVYVSLIPGSAGEHGSYNITM